MTNVQPVDYEVVIVGAGLTGMHQLHRLREHGISVRVFEAGGDLGGTWYWNRYPGARLDSESYTYAYAFSDELLDEWEWTELFVGQPELLKYYNYVADRLDLRRDIQFNSRIMSAEFKAEAAHWEFEIEDGTRVTARFLVTAVGVLSAPIMPEIPGLEDFEGEWYHTGLWPDQVFDFSNKRVAVIGTGASGIQLSTELAKTALELKVFQRTPDWAVPLRNRPLAGDDTQARMRADKTGFFDGLRNTFGGFSHTFDTRPILGVAADKRLEMYEEWWAGPGFSKWYGAAPEVYSNVDANTYFTEFVASKIRDRVTDPELADKLVPKYPYGTRRVPCESGYYEIFNQSNVELVDVLEYPIERISSSGIVVNGHEHEVDFIAFATGFDAYTGGLTRLNVKGIDGLPLNEKWGNGPKTFLGLGVPGFPNMFTLVGPHNKGSSGNIGRCSEQNVEWVTACIVHMRENELTTIEATQEAADKWGSDLFQQVEDLVPPELRFDKSFVYGANVPGKPRVLLAYLDSLPTYKAHCDKVADNSYSGFEFT